MYNNKKAQFWIIAIILAYLAVLTVFFYVRSADRAGVSLFEQTSDLDMQNIINAIKIRNIWLASSSEDWFNLSWRYRRMVTVTTSGANMEIPTLIALGESSNCLLDIRTTYMNNTELPSNISATTPPGCNITMVVNSAPFEFYTYYGNPSAALPSYRSGSAQQGTETSATIGSKIEVPTINLCEQINSIYPRRGIQVNCSLIGTACTGTCMQANISLYFSANDLKYNGTISPTNCPAAC